MRTWGLSSVEPSASCVRTGSGKAGRVRAWRGRGERVVPGMGRGEAKRRAASAENGGFLCAAQEAQSADGPAHGLHAPHSQQPLEYIWGSARGHSSSPLPWTRPLPSPLPLAARVRTLVVMLTSSSPKT